MEIQFLHLQKFQGRIWKGAMKGKQGDKQIKELNRERNGEMSKRERKKDSKNRKMGVFKVLFEILKYSMNL